MSRRILNSLIIALGLGLLLAQPLLGSLSATSSSRAHAAAASPAGSPASHATLAAGYGQLPLAFELNEGQTNSAVRFLAHGSGYTLFLTPGAAVLNLQQGTAPANSRMGLDAFARANGTMRAGATTQALGMRWLGANPNPTITGEDPLPGTVNYFIGNDPAQWHTHIPTYQQVRLHDVYPGVDLVYYGTGGQLEYDFVVAPGADPAAIHLGFSGAQRLGVDLAGNLSLTLPGGALQQDQPAIYQTVNGTRRAVPGGFTLTPTHQVGFALGAYNPHLPLVIDPSYKFSTYLGGSDVDSANSIVVDSTGNAYIAGYSQSANFPTVNPAQAVNAGSGDAFISKFNAAGTAFIYSTYLGGSGGDDGLNLTVDGAGDAYVFGLTHSTNFPVLNAYQSTPNDLFVTKLTADGSGLYYSTYFGAIGGEAGYDFAGGIAVDSSGNAYLTGDTSLNTFPTLNPIQASNAGGTDAYVTKLNATGNGLVYSTYLGGSSDDQADSIAVDPTDAVYISGYTDSLNFPTTAGVFQPHMATNGNKNAFIAKLAPTGSALSYSTYLGGDNGNTAPHKSIPTGRGIQQTGFAACYGCGDGAYAIAVDTSGDAYITGSANSPNFPTTPGAFQTTYPGPCCLEHTFVSKLTPTASALIYSTFVAGSTGDGGDAIAVDMDGNAYITGYTASTDYPLVNPLQSTLGPGGQAAIVTKLNADGSALLYSSYLGGSDGFDQSGHGIALDAGRDAYVVGSTIANDFPVKNAFQSKFGGNEDAFVAKMRLWPSVDTTTGVFRPANGVLYLKNANTTGPADITLHYGKPGDQPVVGDWTGKGYRSIGIFRNGTFYLRNSNTTGYADLTVTFGASGDLPVAGDWTGKGYDSVGVFRNGVFYLRNTNTSGGPDLTVYFGAAGDLPVVGDWTGKGYDSIGVYRPSTGTFYLRNSNTSGAPDITVTFGASGDLPIVGDWTAKGYDSIGVYRNGTYFLRNANTTGAPDLSFTLGIAGDQPIAGPWLAPPGSGAVIGASKAPARAPASHPAALPADRPSPR